MSKAKQKTVSRSKRKRTTRQPGWNTFLRRAALIIVIIGLLYLFAPSLRTWGINMFTLFGFGLAIIAIALGVIIWVVWGGHFSASVRRWNWFVGGAILALAIWGVLSFFSPEKGILRLATFGGRFGQRIIGIPDIVGGLRLAGLVLLGIIFIAPRKFWGGLTNAFRSSWRFFTRIPQPRPKVAAPQIPRQIEGEKEQALPISPEVVSPEIAAKPVATSPSPVSYEQAAWQSRREPIVTPSGWQLPPIDILDKPSEVELNRDDINKRARLIEEALTSYGVETKVVQINMGPTVTQFGVEPGWDRKYKEIKEKGQTRLEEISRTRVRVDRITSLANDLALALAAPSKKVIESGLDTLYFQFDGINNITYEKTRGIKNLMNYKMRVIENCRKAGLSSIVLVATIAKGITDIEIGNVIQFAIDNIDVVRGITFQPVSLCGRISHEDLTGLRITNADVIQEIDNQTGGKIGVENAWYPLSTIVEMGRIIAYLADVEPVEFTCHPDCGFSTYIVLDPDTSEMVPLMEYFDPLKIVDFSNRFWEKIKKKEKQPIKFFENILGEFGQTLDKGLNWLDKQQLKARFLVGMLQYTKKPGKLMELFTRVLLNGNWDSISSFTHGTLLISSMHFQDAYNFDVERAKRCIVHFGVAMPDGSVKECSFCTMNTFHRPNIEKLIAKNLTEKVKNEFDTTMGLLTEEVKQEVARNGGQEKGE